ncbi:MAG: MFS transporter [Chloroflexi bacterium]|nr:MFS transporter [Chloroflexota bacterium]
MSFVTAIKARAHVVQALRFRDYRLFWCGQLISVLGFQMLIVAQGWLIYDLTGSKVQLGLVGLASAVPSILLNLFGGVVADKVDIRRLIIVLQSLSALVMLVLATLTLTHLVEPWHLMAVAFLMGAMGAFDGPSRQAIFPHLIQRDAMMNAVALNSATWQSSRIIGPALAGVLIALVGPAITFYMAAAGFVVFALFLAAVRMPRLKRTSSTNVFADMVEGLKYIRSNRTFLFLLGMSFFNSFFGMSYIFLMPVFQKDVLGVGPSGLGVLLGMGGAGALLGTVLVASLGNIRSKGLMLIGGAVAFGCLLMLFAYSHWFLASLLLVALAGASASIYLILIQGTLQMLVPNQFRGRVMGFWGMTYQIMPLGGFQAGVLATFVGPSLAVALGGLAVVLFALLGAVRNVRIRRLGTEPASA